MTDSPSLKNLRGIVPPLVTPLLDRDQLDHPGLECLIEHVIQGGVHGVFALGTTGEAPSLSYRLRREVIETVCDRVAGRVPVLIGITDTSFVETVALATYAAECGADAVVLATPYYFPAGQTELKHYIRHVVAEISLPLVLYNMPSLTKVWFEIDTLKELSELGSIIGVKDSGGDLDYFAELTQLRLERPDWFFMIGPEHLLPEALSRGGHGGVHGGANIYPELFVRWFQAIQHGDSVSATQCADAVTMLQEIYAVGKYASRHIKATKSALSIKGICADFLAEPFHHFLAPERARVDALMQQVDAKLATA